jgi:hypothetical protein
MCKDRTAAAKPPGNECRPQFETIQEPATKLEVKNRALRAESLPKYYMFLKYQQDEHKSRIASSRRGDVYCRDDTVLAMVECISALRSTWAATFENEASARRAIRLSGLWGGHVPAAFDADTAGANDTPRDRIEAATCET